MAITKILARNARLDQAIQYVLNGDKTDDRILTAHQNCDPGWEYQQMMETKRAVGKLDGRQCYYIIQSFKPGEVTPELALEIAKEFAAEYLSDYEVVIGTQPDQAAHDPQCSQKETLPTLHGAGRCGGAGTGQGTL